MVNEERVILMTKMAAYEEGEGKKNIDVGNYFRADYISMQILKTVICTTIAFGLIFGVYVLYNFETLMSEIYNMDLLAFAKQVLLYYLVFVGAYSVLAYIVYTIQYALVRKKLKKYYQNLKKLNALYKEM